MAKTKKKNKGGGGTKKKAKAAKQRSFKGGNNARPGNFGGGAEDGASAKASVDNPFEIRMHRAKHDNLGRRARHEKGVPGISRSKGIEKRRETLLKEYKIRNKSSLLVDKRIGEKIKNMSEEEKIIQRSVLEKRRQYKQKSIFNLPSTDDFLTHKGQALMDIDRYDDPRDESDSDDERLNEEFVSDAHFSGDFLKVKAKETEEANDDDKSRKDIIAELILNSKKRKMEKAKEADENYELVSKLDQEFKTPDFRNLLNFVRKEGAENKEITAKKEDYDKIVRELHFESKTGLASNRLKTEEEAQEEELQKLKKLEKERIRRMQAQDPTAPRHKSADELNDEYEIEEDVPIISYQPDGKMNKIASESDEDSTQEEEEDEESGEESSDSDAHSDLDSEAEEEDANEKHASSNNITTGQVEDETSIAAGDDIPYTLALPNSYESFKKLLSKYRTLIRDDQKVVSRFKVVTERLVKYTLLAEKSRSPDLFIYLLRVVIEGVDEVESLSENLKNLIGIATVHLHSVLLTNPIKCAELIERQIIQPSVLSDKANKLCLSKIVLFDICSKLFCVTDFCHRILSPMKVRILDIISSSSVGSYMELLKVLSLVDILYEVNKESKRYCPEVSKLLLDILEAISLSPEKLRFKRRRFEFLKNITSLESGIVDWESEKQVTTLTEADNLTPSPDQLLSLLLQVFGLINKHIEIQHKTRVFNGLIFKFLTAERLVLKMKWTDANFHKALFSNKLAASSMISSSGSLEEELPAIPVNRPKMLKLYEPLIEENFDGNRRSKQKRKGQTQEEARLSHKVKREMKSAVREIMKDNAFLAKQQLKDQAKKDDERSRKVKELLGSLSNQEGDYRRLKNHK